MAAADAEILNGLQIECRAGHALALAANASDNFVGAEFAFAERLELREHARGAAAAAAAGEGGDRVDSGIAADDIGEGAHLLRHGGEREILITQYLAVDTPGVLLREEALGCDDEEIEVEADGADGDEKNQELM